MLSPGEAGRALQPGYSGPPPGGAHASQGLPRSPTPNGSSQGPESVGCVTPGFALAVWGTSLGGCQLPRLQRVHLDSPELCRSNPGQQILNERLMGARPCIQPSPPVTVDFQAPPHPFPGGPDGRSEHSGGIRTPPAAHPSPAAATPAHGPLWAGLGALWRQEAECTPGPRGWGPGLPASRAHPAPSRGGGQPCRQKQPGRRPRLSGTAPNPPRFPAAGLVVLIRDHQCQIDPPKFRGEGELYTLGF